jgi:hypothetical protein
MATIYLDIPNYTPDYIIVKQAVTSDGTQTEVVNATYGSFPRTSTEVVVDSVDIDDALYSFVYYQNGGELTEALILAPADSLSITMKTLFEKTILRLNTEPPVKDFISTVQHVLDFIDRRLHILQSDIIKEDTSFALDADEYQVPLPSGFLGMDGLPYIATTTLSKRDLTPLPDVKRGTYADTGTPEHYTLRGGNLNVYPTCNESTTVNFTSYQKSFVDDLADNVPYDGLFNDTIVELVVKFQANPISVVDPILEAMVYRAVDRAVSRRAPKNIYFSKFAQRGDY